MDLLIRIVITLVVVAPLAYFVISSSMAGSRGRS